MYEHISNYLVQLKKMIDNNSKIILSNRDKNMIFCENNNINTEKIKNILRNLSVEDFCKIMDNKGIDKTERLYLFAPNVKLKNNKYQQIYIKINTINDKNIIILVSFHKSKYYLKPKFKNWSVI